MSDWMFIVSVTWQGGWQAVVYFTSQIHYNLHKETKHIECHFHALYQQYLRDRLVDCDHWSSLLAAPPKSDVKKPWWENQTRPWSSRVSYFPQSHPPSSSQEVGQNVGEKGQKNCPESKDKASKELDKLLRDQICHDHRHVISKWSLSVQSIKKYPCLWPRHRA